MGSARGDPIGRMSGVAIPRSLDRGDSGYKLQVVYVIRHRVVPIDVTAINNRAF